MIPTHDPSYHFHCTINENNFDVQIKKENGGIYSVNVVNESSKNPLRAIKIQDTICEQLSKEPPSSELITAILKDLGATQIEKVEMESSSTTLKVDALRAKSLDGASKSKSSSPETVKKKTTPSTIVNGDLGHQLDELLTNLVKKEHLSGSIRIVKNGEVLLQKGYGKASETENNPETVFRLASISKSLTAAVIMRLQDKEKLNVLDPISKYLPFVQKKIQDLKEQLITLKEQKKLALKNVDELDKEISENIEQTSRLASVTIEHLLTHRSGLPQLEEAEPQAITSFQLSEHHPKDYIDRLKDKPIATEPGTDYTYNNYGYLLLAQIIENVSNKPYADVMQEEVFTPLKMNASSCPILTREDIPDAQPHTLKLFKREDLARYITWIDGAIAENPDEERLSALKKKRIECEEQLKELEILKEPIVPVEVDHCSVRVGSGNINSNVIDLAKFEEALSRDFLSKNSQAILATKGYGWDKYGASVEELILGEKADGQGKRGWMMKDGQLNGTHTVIWRFPDTQTSVIMLCNSDMDNLSRGDLGAISIEISKLLLT